MNPKNIVLHDKNGTNILMLAAAGFLDRHTLDKVLENVGTHRIRKFLKRKDLQGRGVEEYARMNKEEISQMLRSVGVNPHKAHNHCFDSLFAIEGYHIAPNTETTINMLKKLGLQLSETTIQNETHYSVDATAENARKVILMATEQKKTDPYCQAREAIIKEWEVTLGRSEEESRKIWKNYNRWAGKLLAQERDGMTISDVSLVDRVMARQAENLAWMKSFFTRERPQTAVEALAKQAPSVAGAGARDL